MENIFNKNKSIKISTSIIKPDSWGCITEGYYWSIKLLFESIINSNNYQNMWVAYAILFNIRHYYELSLKDILVNLGYIYNEKYLIENHNLKDLINEVEIRATEYYNKNKDRLKDKLLVNDISGTIHEIRNEMNFFIKYDNDSYSFRYPYSKKNKALITEEINFDCISFYESLNKCRRLLTRISTELLCDDENPIFKKGS